MRLVLLIALVFSASAAFAQADLWTHVSTERNIQSVQPATLSSAQLDSFARILRKQKPDDLWDCEPSEIDDLIKGLSFESIPISENREMMLVEAGRGCARGGQGANGAMWLIRFDGPDGATPILLATPKEFSGWLFSVQPTMSHGYPDIVLGWHMSAGEAGLSYFRFDGKSYHLISTASLLADDEGNQKIVPAKP
jgi:hypothetical protein